MIHSHNTRAVWALDYLVSLGPRPGYPMLLDDPPLFPVELHPRPAVSNIVKKTRYDRQLELGDRCYMHRKTSNVSFVELDLRDQDFSGAVFENCDFQFANLSNTIAVDATFISCKFLNAKFKNIRWVRPRFLNCPDIEDHIIIMEMDDPCFA